VLGSSTAPMLETLIPAADKDVDVRAAILGILIPS